MAILEKIPGLLATGGYPVVPPPVPWTPAELGSALRGWWVPDTLALSPGTLIPSLPSSGGVTNTLAQATSGRQPTYQLFNSKGAMEFDGTDDYMDMSDLTISNAAPALVMWGLFKHQTIPADAAYKFLMSIRVNVGSPKRMAMILNNAAGVGKKIGITLRSLDGASTINLPSATTVDTNPHVLISQVVYDGSGAPAIDIWQDGTNILSNVPAFTPAPTTASDSGLSPVGADGTVANSAVNCLFSQSGVNRGSIAVIDRQKLEGYLAWYGGIEANLPVGHPYRNAPPYL